MATRYRLIYLHFFFLIGKCLRSWQMFANMSMWVNVCRCGHDFKPLLVKYTHFSGEVKQSDHYRSPAQGK